MNSRQHKAGAAALAMALVALFFVQGWWSLHHKAPTFDEVGYFGIGQYLIEKGDFAIPGAGTHPPLFFYLSSLPQLGTPLHEEHWTYSAELRESKAFTLAHDFVRGRALLADDAPNHPALNRSRTVLLGLAFLLGPLIFYWSFRAYGPWGALVSTAFFAFEPNLLAHARLITPDFTLTVMLFATAFFASLASGSSGRHWQWVCAGIFGGLALLSKHTALAMLPAIGCSALALWFRRGAPRREIFLMLAAVGIALVVLGVGVRFDLGHYAQSLQLQVEHARGGHSAYLWGEIREGGWWYYIFTALALKTPLPLLVVLLGAVVLGFRGQTSRITLMECSLPGIALLSLFFFTQVPNIGLRYALPLFPFACVMAGSIAPLAARQKSLRWILAGLMIWHVAGSLRTYPDYLAYFNEAAAGPAAGYQHLVDSNLDWGQDLKALKAYLDDHPQGPIRLSYFGTADPKQYGIQHRPLPSYPFHQDASPPRRWRGTFAISATHLVGLYLAEDYYERFRALEPDAVIGHSIFIYHLQ